MWDILGFAVYALVKYDSKGADTFIDKIVYYQLLSIVVIKKL